MREIKFRAFNLHSKTMHEVSAIDFTDKSCEIIIDSEGYTVINWFDCGKESDCILMQYTGLKDKNDKEIYEGDILVFLDGEKYPKTKVIWDSGAFYLIRPGERKSLNSKICKNYSEVIGNIYENPELLESD